MTMIVELISHGRGSPLKTKLQLEKNLMNSRALKWMFMMIVVTLQGTACILSLNKYSDTLQCSSLF